MSDMTYRLRWNDLVTIVLEDAQGEHRIFARVSSIQPNMVGCRTRRGQTIWVSREKGQGCLPMYIENFAGEVLWPEWAIRRYEDEGNAHATLD